MVENKLAKDWYQETYRELANLMNQHYQISQINKEHESLPAIQKQIDIVGACCETWKAVARINAINRLMKGG